MEFILPESRLVGPKGDLLFPADDVVARRLLMLCEGQCEGLGGQAAALKYGVSKPRYYQLLAAFSKGGSSALQPQKTGPKAPHARTDEVVRQVIRHRFLDPDASADVIAQKLRQAGFALSIRSVERVIADFGLQKKTL
jgi:transposase